METYKELKERQQKEFNEFPLGFAFSDIAFKTMMERWGLTENDTNKIYSIGNGGYVRKSYHKALHEMIDRHEIELADAIKNDKTGEGFIYEMFYCEFCNNEYGYTGNVQDTLDVLGYTVADIEKDSRLKKGFYKAKKQIMNDEGAIWQ